MWVIISDGRQKFSDNGEAVDTITDTEESNNCYNNLQQ